MFEWFLEKELTPVEPSIDNLMVGDVLVSKSGNERKVQEVFINTIMLSLADSFDLCGSLWLKSEIKEAGFTLTGEVNEELSKALEVVKRANYKVEKKQETDFGLHNTHYIDRETGSIKPLENNI